MTVGTLAVFALAGAGATATRAQATGELRGVVIDAGSRAPIAGAEISFTHIDLATVTDERGRYALPEVPSGRHTLLVRGEGFTPAVARYHVILPDTVNVLNFELDRAAHWDDGAGRPAPGATRPRGESSTFIRREELPMNTALIRALSERLPGFRVPRSQPALTTGERLQRRVGFGGEEQHLQWIMDGVFVAPRLTLSVSTSDVRCVEVRRAARGSALPARGMAAAPDGQQRVIVVWTVRGRESLPAPCEGR